MAVALKLYRLGKRKNPIYRIVAIDKRAKRNGEYIEVIGTYNPMVEPAKIELNEEKLNYWLEKGAQVADGVRKLLKKTKKVKKG
jgi:small subunit ribosomal protein S16